MFISGRPSYHALQTSTINIPVVVYLAYGSTANFRFRGQIASINIPKESQGYGDRSGPTILEID